MSIVWHDGTIVHCHVCGVIEGRSIKQGHFLQVAPLKQDFVLINVGI